MVAKGEVSYVRVETAQGSTIYGQQGGWKKSIVPVLVDAANC